MIHTPLEIVGIVAIWLVGAVAAFYLPALIMLRRRGGLEVIAASVWIGGACLVVYLVASMIYFAAT